LWYYLFMSSEDGRRLYEEDKRHKNDTEMSFLGRWSILSGGTFSLLIPLLQSLGEDIIYKKLFVIGGILLIASLISSLLGMFFLKEYIRDYNFFLYNVSFFSFKKFNIAKEKVRTFFSIASEVVSTIAMISYIVGIIFIAIFINANLL